MDSVNLDICNTDGPLTRAKRRAMKGLTPGAVTDTPGLLNGTPMARELFTDKTNFIGQVSLGQNVGEESSPVHGWIKPESGGLDLMNEDSDLPLTPNLFMGAQAGKSALKHSTPCGAGPSEHGPTPNNTPAAGVATAKPEQSILNQAVTELRGENQENGGSPLSVAKANNIISVQKFDDASPLHNRDECAGEPEEEQAEDLNNDTVEDIIADLDNVALASPVEGLAGLQSEGYPSAPSIASSHDEPLDDSIESSSTSESPSGPPMQSTPQALPSSSDFVAGNGSVQLASVEAQPPSACKYTPACKPSSTDVGNLGDSPMLSFDCTDPLVPVQDSREDTTHHTDVKEPPVSAGPFPDVPAPEAEATLFSTAATPTAGAPGSARAGSIPQKTPVQLDAAGREDELPTPGFFQPVSSFMAKPIESPVTPEDAAIKPFCFAKSAGSHFATPEVPISCGMTPMTTTEERQAHKHIPAWNRVSTMVDKQMPLVSKIVQGLWKMPSEQPAWAKTPFMLLHAVCASKGWELTVCPESESRIGAGCSIFATVNMPAHTVDGEDGQTLTSTGKNQGHLEALLLAAAGILEQLLKSHMITGKDATAAMEAAPATIRSGSVPSLVGGTLLFGPSAAAGASSAPSSSFQAARAKFSTTPAHRPPVPLPPRSAKPASHAATPALPPTSTPLPKDAPSPHPGIGVRAPTNLVSGTPELVPVSSPTAAVTMSAKAHTPRQSKALTPVYHPPMRTGVSSVSNKLKASIGATAKPTGLKALKEQQKVIERNMKKDNERMAELTKSVGKISIDSSKANTPLRGLPLPLGTHQTFDDNGEVVHVTKAPQLRGVPAPKGKHIKFDDE